MRGRVNGPQRARAWTGRADRQSAETADGQATRVLHRRRSDCRAAMNGPILGWDVGGANIKAALISGHADARAQVIECAFPLWRDPCRLPTVLTDTANRLGGA